MSTELQDFDVNYRGAVGVAETLESNRDKTNTIWQLEDVVRLYSGVFSQCFNLYDKYCAAEKAESVEFVIEAIRELRPHADTLIEWASNTTDASGVAELRRHLASAKRILGDDAAPPMPSLEDLEDTATDPCDKWLADRSWLDYGTR